MALNPKQAAFVREYLVDLHATQAAIRAGYSAATARQQGSRLLTHADIQAAVAEAQNARARRTEVTADYVLEGIHDLVKRCLQAEQVKGPDGKPIGEYKFDAPSALRGYELLGKHLGLFPNRVDVTVTDSISATLENARRRASEKAEIRH